MKLQTHLIETVQFHNRVIGMRTDGLSHAETMLQLPFPGNCMNWNLGHLMVYRDRLVGTINRVVGEDPDEFAIYGAGSPPLTDDNNALQLESIMARIQSGGEKLCAALEALEDGRINEIHNPENGSTLGQHLNFYIAFHEAYHLGQLEPLKELALSQRA